VLPIDGAPEHRTAAGHRARIAAQMKIAMFHPDVV